MTYKSTRLRHAFLVALLLSVSCIMREPGTSVEVELAAVSSSAQAPRSELITNLGYQIQLESFYVVLSRVELIPCADAPTTRLWRDLFGPSTAHAHGQNTMTAWAVPNVLAPLVDTAPVSIAVLHPPARSFCSLRISVEAADADAERMPSEVDMNGLSMFITGSYGENTAHSVTRFLYQSFVSSNMELRLLDRAGANPLPLTLSADNLNVRLRIEFAYQQLFDDLTLYPGAFSAFGDVVLAQALTHAKVVVLDE